MSESTARLRLGDFPDRAEVRISSSDTTGGKHAHIYEDCPSVKKSSKMQTKLVGVLFDDTPLCEWCQERLGKAGRVCGALGCRNEHRVVEVTVPETGTRVVCPDHLRDL